MKSTFALFLLLLVGGLPIRVQADQIDVVSVRANGVGQSEVKAIDNALSRAVGQVNGIYLKSVLTTRERLEESDDGKSTTSNYQGSVIDNIESRTKGAVKSYSVASLGRDPSSGLIKATIDARIPVLRRSEQLSRMRVAVVSGKGADPALTAPADAAVEEFLVSTRKFAVLDRKQTDAADREFARIRDGLTPIEDMARTGVAPAADFLVLITVRRTSGGGREQLSGAISLLDYATGQLRYSRSTALALMGSSSTDVEGVARRLGKMLASQMADYGFPASVIGVAGNELTIDAGETRFSVGDPVQVFRSGGRLKDPNTRENRGVLEIPAGTGKITRVGPAVSVVVLDTPAPVGQTTGNLVRRLDTVQAQTTVDKDVDDFLGGGK